MSTLVEQVEELADFFAEQAEDADAAGRLSDTTAKALRELGVMKILHPADFGGLEGSPVDFYRSVLSIGSRSSSAGWVVAVVGVHAFELAQGSRRLQQDVWGEDPDTWVASPYAPFGRAKPVDGGYLFSGRWPFSSGTDLCDWAVLGGLVTDADGTVAGPDAGRHFIVPRADYEIQHDSWEVVGLKGTGSKDLVITEAFVPEHRLIDPVELGSFEAARKAGRADSPTYRMPFHMMFNGTITAGTIAAAIGALASCTAYMRSRVTGRGVTTARDPHHLYVLGEASADIAAGEAQFLRGVERMWELAQAGKEIPISLRAELRRDQVRAVHRAVAAADQLVTLAGGAAMRLDSPIQRFWRDAHVGLSHQANQADPVYQAYGLERMGLPLPATARL